MKVRERKEFVGMEKVKEILRLFELGRSRTEIADSCRVGRATVRDYLRKAEAGGLTYTSICELSEPEIQSLFGKKKPGRQIKYAPLDYDYIQRELSQPGVTLELLWEEHLKGNPNGYSYSHYCNCYREWRLKKSVTMRMTHKGGEKLFVDYAGHTVEIVNPVSGEVSRAQIFVAALGASNYTYVEATESQELAHWIGSHIRAFKYFGGVPSAVVPDNLTSGVTQACYYEPGINRSYQELAEHYSFAVLPARVKHPQDKAKVEEAVKNVETRILAALRNQVFHSTAELNAAIKPLLEALNARGMQVYGKSRRELFEELDKPALKPLPAQPFSLSSWKQARVNIDYHIEVKRHYYSVPFQLVHELVNVRITEYTIEVLLKGKRVALHNRSNAVGKYTTFKEHMPPAHQFMADWSPTRIMRWAEKIGPQTLFQVSAKLESRQHPEQSYRACLGLLSLAKKYGNERLEAACQKINRFGPVPLRSIKSILESGSDRAPTPQTQSAPVLHANIRNQDEFN
jgi:transposase